ncbi:S-layer homology domain-containing protein [Sporosarcina sp. 179-K 3D1 HS]|uniref:S-layer homology domain-containing protein n=1 Tax=Sporosarcina sp. 179-K 3D1 HS TaxID=3232169 RepID=UPI0039A3EC17
MRKVLVFLLTLVLMVSLVPQAKGSNHTFKDVPKNHPNYTEIMYLLEMGVIEPTEKFGVNQKVTREEVAVMVSKAIGLNGNKTKTKFKDVPESRYSSGYINSAVEAGIINGYPDGTFKPTNLVTRGHMAAFIANAFKLTNQADINFKDVPKGSTAYVAVKKLVAANITSGYPDGTFKPNEGLTRAHISAFIARAMNPDFRPQPRKIVTRGISFDMGINDVKKLEGAKLIEHLKDYDVQALIYKVEKFGYSAKLTYYFENGKLNYIMYDFLPNKNSFHTSGEIKALHNMLLKQAVNELGTNYFTADNYSGVGTLWNKDGYDVMLSVNDKNLYTSALLSFHRK